MTTTGADDRDEAAPLIVTLTFDEKSQVRFDAMRRRHFPPARNHLSAHLTLFHKLPGDERDAACRVLEDAASDCEPLALEVDGVRFLGYGSAYTIRSAALSRLRADLALSFEAWLTPQDSQRFAPHVTIQNKAPAQEARALFESLSAEFEPFTATATGLSLWRYLGGPWEAAGTFPFRDEP